MKDFTHYQNKMTLPCKDNFVSFQVNNISTMEIVHKSLSIENLKSLGFKYVTASKGKEIQKNDFIVIRNDNKDGFDKANIAYRQEAEAKRIEFAHDLAVEHDINPDSKEAKIIFNKAYEEGHSGGLSSIASEYEDLVLFIENLDEARKQDNN